MKPAHRHLLELLALEPGGTLSPGCVRWLQAGAIAWMRNGGTPALNRFLDCPSPDGLRRIQRNELLREAAALLEAETPWQRAGKLRERVRLFELRKWPVWFRLDTAPPHATDLERVLFELLRLETELPDTHRQYHTILLGE